MSSSSSTDVGPRLVGSLRAIRDRNPAGFRELVEAVGSLRVELEVGDEQLLVAFEAGQFWVRVGASPDADAHVSTDRMTIEDVIGGSTDLLTAVMEDRLLVRGPIDDLIRLHDGLQAYVRAVMATPEHRTGLFA